MKQIATQKTARKPANEHPTTPSSIGASWSSSFSNKPIFAKDIQSLRYTLGYSYRETLYLLGYPQKVLMGDKETDDAAGNQVVEPSLSILIRMLWAYPEDCPMPEMPSVQEMRKRFASLATKRGRDGLASANWLAVLSGARYNNGADWQSQGKSPAPPTKRLFWIISHMADKYGEKEALRRWMAAAEAEADARGTTLQTILDNRSGWPKLPGEKVSGGSVPKKFRAAQETSDDAEDE
ncbi:MAG: hypothetical protein ACYCQL_00720 [Acidithiobacillus sp.]